MAAYSGDDVSEDRLKLDADDGDNPRGRSRADSDDYGRNSGSSRSRSRSHSITSRSYSHRSNSRSVSRGKSRSRSATRSRSRSASMRRGRSSSSRSRSRPSRRSRSASSSRSGSRQRRKSASPVRRGGGSNRDRAPVRRSRSRDGNRAGGRSTAGVRGGRSRSPGLLRPPRRGSPGLLRPRAPSPPRRGPPGPPFGPRDPRFMGPPGRVLPPFGGPFWGPPPPDFRGRPPPMMDRGPPFGPPFGPPMPRRRSPPPPPPSSSRYPPERTGSGGRYDSVPPPGLLTREITRSRIPPPSSGAAAKPPPDQLHPPPPPKGPSSSGGGGGGGQDPFGLGPAGLLGPGAPASGGKIKRARGGQRVRRKKERERMAAEGLLRSGSEGAPHLSGANRLPLGSAAATAGRYSDRSLSPEDGGAGSSGEYVMVDAPATGSRPASRDEVRQYEHDRHGRDDNKARQPRVRSAVVAAGSRSPAPDDERCAKKSRQHDPADAAAATTPYVGSAVMAQRQVSLSGRHVMTAEERERERQKQKQQEQQQQQEKDRDKQEKQQRDSRKSRDKTSKSKADSRSPPPVAAALADTRKPGQQPEAAPAMGGILDGVPERLKGRLGLPLSGSGSPLVAAAEPAPAVAAAPGLGHHVEDRWQPGTEDLEDVHLLPNPKREQHQQKRRTQQQHADAAPSSSRSQHAAAGNGAPAAATMQPAGNAGAALPHDADVFGEFAVVWYWKDESVEIGPNSIRKIRRLVHNLPPRLKSQMMNTECYTKQHEPEVKLLKHLLDGYGDPDAPEPK